MQGGSETFGPELEMGAFQKEEAALCLRVKVLSVLSAWHSAWNHQAPGHHECGCRPGKGPVGLRATEELARWPGGAVLWS